MLKYGSYVKCHPGGRCAFAAPEKQTIAEHNAPIQRPNLRSPIWLPFFEIQPVLSTSTLTIVNRRPSQSPRMAEFVTLLKRPIGRGFAPQDTGELTVGIQGVGGAMRNNDRQMISRRRFLKQAGAIAVASLSGSDRLALASLTSAGTKNPSPSVIKNKAPLAQNAFYMLPLGAVRPSGWLKKSDANPGQWLEWPPR